MSSGIYDLVIIGDGPAGLTAGIYASRMGMKTLILERALALSILISHRFRCSDWNPFNFPCFRSWHVASMLFVTV